MQEQEPMNETPDNPAGLGLETWSQEPFVSFRFEAVGPEARVAAVKEYPPDSSWYLRVEYRCGTLRERPFCTAGSLQQWMALENDLRDLLAEVARITGVTSPLPDPADPSLVSAMDTTRLTDLGWRPGGMGRLRAALPSMLSR